MKKLMLISSLFAISAASFAAEPETPASPEPQKMESKTEVTVDAQSPKPADVTVDTQVTQTASADDAQKTQEKSVQDQPVVQDSAALIGKLDQDKDGKLTIKEAMSDPVLLASFGKIDTNSDGQLSLEELQAVAAVKRS